MEVIIAEARGRGSDRFDFFDNHAAGIQVYLDNEFGEGGDEALAGGGLDLVDIIGRGFEDIGDCANLLVFPGDGQEANELESVEPALGEGVKIRFRDLEQGAAKGLGVFGGVDVLELEDPAVFLGSAGGNFEGLIVDEEDAARGEAVGEVGEGFNNDASAEAEGFDYTGDGDVGVGHGGWNAGKQVIIQEGWIPASAGMTGLGRRGLDDFEDGSYAALGGGDAQKGAHGLGDSAFTAYDLALVVCCDFKADDNPVFLFLLGHYNGVGVVSYEPGKVFDELFHPPLTFCKAPVLFKSLATLSVGWAPFLSQSIAFSSSIVRAGGSGMGS